MAKASQYIEFTSEMKKDYNILVPNMLPMHFKLIIELLRREGYNIELLENEGDELIQTGLKYTHNDACYPAILVVGQFIQAIESGKYDPHKLALIMVQTGGGCRASNYIFLIRKALERAGYGYIPVISFSVAGLEKHSGFRLSLSLVLRLFYAVIYGDLIMSLVNQCKPYELNQGASMALAEEWSRRLAQEMQQEGLSFLKCKQRVEEILESFAQIPREQKPRVQVGIVGEIYVKFSPLGNNRLEQLLVENGAEVTLPGLYDFCLYCVYNNMMDYELYKRGNGLAHSVFRFVYDLLLRRQKTIIELTKKHGVFRPQGYFPHTVELIRPYMGLGCKMGEGWLLPAEMLELADQGVKNIVCAQPFGCLPNHIVGKGMMKPLRDKNPEINIVAIDYDGSASKVNQENRVKLMLANAREQLEAEAAGQ